MSRRQRKHEIQNTLWYMPLVYVLGSLVLVAITLFLDLKVEIFQYTHTFFQSEAQSTRVLVSTLIGGILTLSAFTLNSVLVVLTTFSGQFSPRMLLNFISDRNTQHALGIFNGSFVYVLAVFLFIANRPESYYTAIPLTTVGLAFFTAMTFIYFINHATTWMQVHNITYSMNTTSKRIVQESLKNELERYRIESPGSLLEEHMENKHTTEAVKSGYLQIIDYRNIIESARKDGIIIQMHAKVGDFILKGNRLFSYWGPSIENIDQMKYCKMIEIGHKETEMQDIKMGMTKLSEIAIKGLGNNDPQTAINTIHQMGELLVSVESYISFTPYLGDQDHHVRVVMESEDFSYYLYRGFGYIRHYAQDNYPIITEIISVLGLVAQNIDESKHDRIWEFACNTVDHISTEFIYDLDRHFLLSRLYTLAFHTNKIKSYYNLEKSLLKIEENQ
ncbi:DUF2254 domain-containing protein [Thalassobacillus hwangdonensis]|uniref:DUF2254 domain-containing protein n=2 Tax=Thalassobacillus hwangdonensis TaxID=546108 RepID=A0ABW3L0D5_9BACI